jgi:DNA-binding response OmpR family regulator
LEIFLIEDNKGDVGLIEKFFKDTKIRIRLYVAENGEEAVRDLYGENNFLGSLRQDIIILGLNLPKKDGSEVFREIEENNDL